MAQSWTQLKSGYQNLMKIGHKTLKNKAFLPKFVDNWISMYKRNIAFSVVGQVGTQERYKSLNMPLSGESFTGVLQKSVLLEVIFFLKYQNQFKNEYSIEHNKRVTVLLTFSTSVMCISLESLQLNKCTPIFATLFTALYNVCFFDAMLYTKYSLSLKVKRSADFFGIVNGCSSVC